MIKLNRQVEALERILEQIEEKQQELQDKMDAIEDHACDMDRDLTASEQNRFDKLQEKYE